MKLNKVVSLNSWFSKSVNLERDSSTSEALSSYVPTSVSKRMLSSFFESQKKDKRLSRAWSLIGPYGSGKSSFALFLTACPPIGEMGYCTGRPSDGSVDCGKGFRRSRRSRQEYKRGESETKNKSR